MNTKRVLQLQRLLQQPQPLRLHQPAPVALSDGEPVNAPMPGNILRIDVKEGDKVKAGQTLLILEAMKMENEIAAPKDGTVVQIATSKGAVVETGTPLIVLA